MNKFALSYEFVPYSTSVQTMVDMWRRETERYPKKWDFLKARSHTFTTGSFSDQQFGRGLILYVLLEDDIAMEWVMLFTKPHWTKWYK